MRYDVFLSYARENAQACDAIYEALDGFGLHVFMDRRSLGAGRWLANIRAELAGSTPPTVVVLASHWSTESPYVKQELDLVREPPRNPEVPILVVELEPGAGRLPQLALDAYQALDASNRDLSKGLDEALKNELWLRLNVRPTTQMLTEIRSNAAQWCDSLLLPDRVDFWGGAWQSYLPSHVEEAECLVLTARGGSGKSVLSAHFVRHLLNTDPHAYPVIVPAESLQGDLSGVTQVLGARSRHVLTDHVARIAKEMSAHILFVVDGLDRALNLGDPDDLIAAIGLLTATAMTVITCRTEAWEFVNPRVSVRQVVVEELSEPVVTAILQQHTPFGAIAVDLLRTPLYLDSVIRLQDKFDDVPRTETEILRVVWNDYAEQEESDRPETSHPRRLLEALAELQLESMAYEVPESRLEAASAYDLAVIAAASALLRHGALIRRVVSGEARVRLRHDLLDCFGMANLILGPATGQARLRKVYERCDEDCGAPLLSLLVQIVHDVRDEALLRDLFIHLLAMLDEKRFGTRYMAERGQPRSSCAASSSCSCH